MPVMTDYTSTGMGDEGAFGATRSDSTARSQLFLLLRFAWGLIPGVPAKSETGAEPTDIILRYAGNGKSFENGVTALTSEICLYKSIVC